ncbi:hypothetical protein BJ166DRAFT_538858 [Pestalotiopsis sp. NC0098]|nr:hypothetical protein BJ166DRAFT_538858 [Pestalotiopsis sp. NC0098]
MLKSCGSWSWLMFILSDIFSFYGARRSSSSIITIIPNAVQSTPSRFIQSTLGSATCFSSLLSPKLRIPVKMQLQMRTKCTH